MNAQRQDSLTDQLKTVYKLANEHGCYDAADFIKSILERDQEPQQGYKRGR